MPDSVGDHGIPLSPLRPAILTFIVDDDGLKYVRLMIDVMQKRYGMTYEQAVEELNARFGAKDGYPPAVMTLDEGLMWWHDTPEHVVRSMYEGNYWRRNEIARRKLEEWQAGLGHGKAVHEYLNWTADQYAKWAEDGTLPPPSADDRSEL